MKRRLTLSVVFCLAVSLLCTATSLAAAEPGAELVQLVIGLLGDGDKDVRALGLEQVRSEAKGSSATTQFAAQLGKLPPEAQVGLLSALADRGDAAARPAVLELLAGSREAPVRVAAIAALGPLGEPADIRPLVELLSSPSEAEQSASRASLIRLRGESVAAGIVAELKQSDLLARVTLIEILAERRALDAVPDLLAAATGAEPAVRAAAMAALGQLAGPEQIAAMLPGVLRAEPGDERAAAERAVMIACGRIDDPHKRAEPLLAALETLAAADRTALLPTLGRVGGSAALTIVETAVASPDAAVHDAGIRSLCNWPDASIAPQLIELTHSDEHPDHRALALRALIRVAPLPDGRPDLQRLELVQKALALCTRDEERNMVLARAHAVRVVETLRFLVPFLDQPEFAQQACESVVELAHHRGLREPNKAEFHQALDKVIQISADATVIDRANRYKNNQTWVRPAAPRRR